MSSKNLLDGWLPNTGLSSQLIPDIYFELYVA